MVPGASGAAVTGLNVFTVPFTFCTGALLAGTDPSSCASAIANPGAAARAVTLVGDAAAPGTHVPEWIPCYDLQRLAVPVSGARAPDDRPPPAAAPAGGPARSVGGGA